MSIIEIFKAAGKPTTQDFVQKLSEGQWEPKDVYKACVYAASYGFTHLFEWAYSRSSPLDERKLGKDVAIAASFNGHSFVLERVYANGLAPIDSKFLLKNAAENGHIDFINTLIQKCPLSCDNQVRILINAARKGHCNIVQQFAPPDWKGPSVQMVFKAAVQNGQLNVLKWLEAYPPCKSFVSSGPEMQKMLHEAISNAQSQTVEHLLESEGWAAARRNINAMAFETHMVKNLNALFTVSQKSEKKHQTTLVLVRHIPLQQWEKSLQHINPFHQEYLKTVYAEHQKMVLEKAVSFATISAAPRRKM